MKTRVYRAQRVKNSEHKCEHKDGEKAIAAGMFRYILSISRTAKMSIKKKTSIMRQGLMSIAKDAADEGVIVSRTTAVMEVTVLGG